MKVYVSNTVHNDSVALGSVDSKTIVTRTDFHVFKEFIETSGRR